MTPAIATTVMNHLWQTREGEPRPRVYGILDAARDERIYPKIWSAANESVCLHPGQRAEELAWVSPYLVSLAQGDDLTRWVLETGWGRSWGIFMQSRAAFGELKRHLRALLTVRDEDGKPLFFRYYDPRVLRVYLPTCNADEIRTFFGPVDMFAVESENSRSFLKIARSAKGIRSEELPVESAD